MLKATEIKGKKVIDIQSGEKLASIAELVFNPKEKKLEAYVVDTEGILSDQKILRFANVHAYGPDAVTIKEHSSLEKKSQVTKHLSSLANQKTTPLKTNVVTSDGKKIGSVKELYFSQQTGLLESIEISQGIKDLKSGTKKFKSSAVETIGKDAVIVKPKVKELIKKQGKRQGLQGSLKETKKESEDFLTTAERKSKQAFDTVQKKTKQLTSDHGKKSQSNKKSGEKESDNSDTTQEIKDSLVKGKQYLENKADQVQQKFQQKQKKQALGKYLTKNIISPEDKVIAKRGDMITHQVMKKAENDNLLDQVLNHTSVSQPSQTS